MSKPSKKRLADGSLANHNQNKVRTLASFSIGGLQQNLPTAPKPPARAHDVAKAAVKEQQLRRAIKEAEQRMLGLDLGQPAASDTATAKGTDQAIKSRKQEANRKGGVSSSVGKDRIAQESIELSGMERACAALIRWLSKAPAFCDYAARKCFTRISMEALQDLSSGC